jgi:hypothetical protein
VLYFCFCTENFFSGRLREREKETKKLKLKMNMKEKKTLEHFFEFHVTREKF